MHITGEGSFVSAQNGNPLNQLEAKQEDKTMVSSTTNHLQCVQFGVLPTQYPPSISFIMGLHKIILWCNGFPMQYWMTHERGYASKENQISSSENQDLSCNTGLCWADEDIRQKQNISQTWPKYCPVLKY